MRSSSHHLQILKSMEERAPVTKTWAAQWDELKVLWNGGMPTEEIAENLGRTVSAVLTQAARLGLARRQSPGRKAKAPAAAVMDVRKVNNVLAFKTRDEALEAPEAVDMSPRHVKRDRNCLMCSTSFTSHGSHNRICPRCKTGSAYQVGHDDAYKIMTA